MEKLKFIPLFRIANTPIMMHWSLSVVLIFAAIASINDIAILLGAISFWSIMLIHELGHMMVSSRLGLETFRIELSLMHGKCICEAPETQYEYCLVSWGGVLAQAFFFVPCIAIYLLFDDYLAWYIEIPVLFLGFYSALIAVLNLLPSRYLDGGTCWKAIPLYFKYRNKPVRTKATINTNKSKSHIKLVK